MTDSYYAGVYWPARAESAEECSRRAETYFLPLSQCDALFARWYEQADSLEEALHREFTPDYETLLRFFRREENQLGKDGFSLGAWTGHEEDGHGGLLSLTCGDASGAYPNCCLLYLPWPEVEPDGQRILNVPMLMKVLRAMVLAWEPRSGVIGSDDFRAAMRPEGDRRGFPGWLTYLSQTLGEIPPLPEPVRVESVEDKGSLIILTPHRLSVSNPEHLLLGRQLQDALDARGLLRPVLS